MEISAKGDERPNLATAWKKRRRGPKGEKKPGELRVFRKNTPQGGVFDRTYGLNQGRGGDGAKAKRVLRSSDQQLETRST